MRGDEAYTNIQDFLTDNSMPRHHILDDLNQFNASPSEVILEGDTYLRG